MDKLIVKGIRKGTCGDKKQLNTIFTTVTVLSQSATMTQPLEILTANIRFLVIFGKKIIVGAHVSTQLQWS